jgi:hypothetical protein
MSQLDGVLWSKDLKYKATLQTTIETSATTKREYSLWFDPKLMLEGIIDSYCINADGELDFSTYTRLILDQLFVKLREHATEYMDIEFKIGAHNPSIFIRVTYFGHDLPVDDDDRMFSMMVGVELRELDEIAPGWPSAFRNLGKALVDVVHEEDIYWPLFRAGCEKVKEMSAYKRFF